METTEKMLELPYKYSEGRYVMTRLFKLVRCTTLRVKPNVLLEL